MVFYQLQHNYNMFLWFRQNITSPTLAFYIRKISFVAMIWDSQIVVVEMYDYTFWISFGGLVGLRDHIGPAAGSIGLIIC